MPQNGKGSKLRPRDVDHSTYAENWDTIFGESTMTPQTHDMESGLPFQSPKVECPHGYRCTYRHLPHIKNDNPCANCGRPWNVCTGNPWPLPKDSPFWTKAASLISRGLDGDAK